MGLYIDMEMPKNCGRCFLRVGQCSKRIYMENRPLDCPIIEVPKSHDLEVPEPHGRLIDADALRAKMYHEAFETDTPMQKWDSGCWIRYKMFEDMEESAPTIIPAESEGE